MKTMSKYIALTIVTLVVSGCVESRKMEMPKDYVELDTTYSHFLQRATNAEKCIIALQVKDNLKNATLDFWKDITIADLTRRGYELTHCDKIKTTAGRDGMLLKFKQQDMIYWLAIFPAGDKVYLAEAGGQRTKFKSQEEKIAKAFESLKV